MRKAIIVGSGAGGATAAKELAGAFDVTVLEAGSQFRPFTHSLRPFERLRHTGLLADERLIRLFYPSMRIRKSAGSPVMVNGRCVGGTTVLNTGSALRMDHDLRRIGIDLDGDFRELQQEIPISTDHEARWLPMTRRLHKAFDDMGLAPRSTPKAGRLNRCSQCGRCVLGCRYGAKWDSREFLGRAQAQGAKVVTNATVQRVVVDDQRAIGVLARHRFTTRFHPADLIVVAAGGLGTPVILEHSGFACQPRLSVDPVLCVAAHVPGWNHRQEIPMPFFTQRDGFMISPYFDYLSFFFNKAWRYPAGDILSIMIKLADEPSGRITERGLEKRLTTDDQERLDRGVELSREILSRVGADPEQIFLGTLNAGHPGGVVPLTETEAMTLHHDMLPDNLFLADATLLPKALGNPPMLTIMALAKRVSRQCRSLA